ncbi:hypothetical protein [Salipiger mangrovisoli]|uniref:Uncharacterized protein n=1 Tax=Salipiger mangrovisoli TaxID=2865933 RepID=A0ABR9X2L3_9RHOB|nr:hypothetical protein [Salipiger mangrovisoli]MBE9637778.1 hypothetical protein [Salipiger mangrovisoli]
MLGAMVAPGASVTLDKHGTCRVITNMGDAPVMVPANTPEEWSVGQTAFLNNLSGMSGVGVASCGLDLNMENEFAFICGSGYAQVCADALAFKAKAASDAGYTVHKIPVNKLQSHGLTFAWFQTSEQNIQTLDKVCKTQELVSEAGLYWTMIWNGSGEDPHMIGAIYKCE